MSRVKVQSSRLLTLRPASSLAQPIVTNAAHPPQLHRHPPATEPVRIPEVSFCIDESDEFAAAPPLLDWEPRRVGKPRRILCRRWEGTVTASFTALGRSSSPSSASIEAIEDFRSRDQHSAGKRLGKESDSSGH